MPESYAEALLKLVADSASPRKAVNSIVEVLKKSGRESLLPRIALSLARITARRERKDRVVLTVGKDKDSKKALQNIRPILKEVNVAADEVDVHVDENLIGGWRLEGKERLVDASFKKFLLDVYNRTTL